eukprot:c17749_g1_i2.p1 GENE.c17749_g1_i2~~c17749_g1_i2.p1  ORF type:complete len:744 (+),score=131.52 c17749_g1_i2:64-2232(+)
MVDLEHLWFGYGLTELLFFGAAVGFLWYGPRAFYSIAGPIHIAIAYLGVFVVLLGAAARTGGMGGFLTYVPNESAGSVVTESQFWLDVITAALLTSGVGTGALQAVGSHTPRQSSEGVDLYLWAVACTTVLNTIAAGGVLGFLYSMDLLPYATKFNLAAMMSSLPARLPAVVRCALALGIGCAGLASHQALTSGLYEAAADATHSRAPRMWVIGGTVAFTLFVTVLISACSPDTLERASRMIHVSLTLAVLCSSGSLIMSGHSGPLFDTMVTRFSSVVGEGQRPSAVWGFCFQYLSPILLLTCLLTGVFGCVEDMEDTDFGKVMRMMVFLWAPVCVLVVGCVVWYWSQPKSPGGGVALAWIISLNTNNPTNSKTWKDEAMGLRRENARLNAQIKELLAEMAQAEVGQSHPVQQVVHSQNQHTKARSAHPKYPARAPVPGQFVPWEVDFTGYEPPYFVHQSVLATEQRAIEVDLESMSPEVLQARRSCTGPIVFDAHDKPRNPFGRTGLRGRGLLARWGPNKAVNVIVTRHHPTLGVLQMVSIQRRDTGEWALPGGFLEPNEDSRSAQRRLFETEALGNPGPSLGPELSTLLTNLFSSPTLVYDGYVDDPRNTDNAWVETVASHFHCTPTLALILEPAPGATVRNACWMPLNQTPEELSQLYASHAQIVQLLLDNRPACLTEAPRVHALSLDSSMSHSHSPKQKSVKSRIDEKLKLQTHKSKG